MSSTTPSDMSDASDLEKVETSSTYLERIDSFYTDMSDRSSNFEKLQLPSPSTLTVNKDVKVEEAKEEGSKQPYCALSRNRRRYVLAIVTIAAFFAPLASNIYLPALSVLQQAFGVGATAINATVATFMIVFAFAPLFWTSFSDYLGRRPIYIISLAMYIGANILITALPANYEALLFLRILQAFGSAAVVAMGAGTVADLTEPEHRGRCMSYYLLGPNLGPVFGPVIGGPLAGASWRWIFGFLALLGSVVWIVVVFTLPETLRCRVGNGRIHAEKSTWFIWPPLLATEKAPLEERGPPPPKPTLLGYWKLFRYPPIGLAAFDTAFIYAAYFCIAVNLPRSLEGVYNWSSAAVGASYISSGIALILGSLTGGRIIDIRRNNLAKASETDEVDPEVRLVDQIWGVVICATGTMMYGWFIQREYHPAAVLVSTFITGFGTSWVFVCSTAYLTECVPQQAAGAVALGNMLRNPAGAIGAILTPVLSRKIGIGWFFTGLGLLDLVVVGSAVLMLRYRSQHWRAEKGGDLPKPAQCEP